MTTVLFSYPSNSYAAVQPTLVHEDEEEAKEYVQRLAETIEDEGKDLPAVHLHRELEKLEPKVPVATAASLGKESNPFRILSSDIGRELVVQWVKSYPNEGREENYNAISEVIEFLSNPKNTQGDFVSRAIQRFPIINNLHQRFKDALQKPTIELPACVEKEAVLREFIQGPTFINIGAGLDLLGERSVKVNSKVSQAIGIDIEEQRKTPYPPGVSFKRMTDPSVMPLGNNVADTAAMTFVLHHVDVDRKKYLEEVKRIIRPGGRLVVLEDTFSHELPVEYVDEVSKAKSQKISESFSELKNDEERLSFLHFIDWFTHNFVNRSRAPLVPGNYEPMEVWKSIFEEAGFKVIHQQYLGFSAMGSRNPASRGLFVLEKPNTEYRIPGIGISGASLGDEERDLSQKKRVRKITLATAAALLAAAVAAVITIYYWAAPKYAVFPDDGKVPSAVSMHRGPFLTVGEFEPGFFRSPQWTKQYLRRLTGHAASSTDPIFLARGGKNILILDMKKGHLNRSDLLSNNFLTDMDRQGVMRPPKVDIVETNKGEPADEEPLEISAVIDGIRAGEVIALPHTFNSMVERVTSDKPDAFERKGNNLIIKRTLEPGETLQLRWALRRFTENNELSYTPQPVPPRQLTTLPKVFIDELDKARGKGDEAKLWHIAEAIHNNFEYGLIPFSRKGRETWGEAATRVLKKEKKIVCDCDVLAQYAWLFARYLNMDDAAIALGFVNLDNDRNISIEEGHAIFLVRATIKGKTQWYALDVTGSEWVGVADIEWERRERLLRWAALYGKSGRIRIDSFPRREQMHRSKHAVDEVDELEEAIRNGDVTLSEKDIFKFIEQLKGWENHYRAHKILRAVGRPAVIPLLKTLETSDDYSQRGSIIRVLTGMEDFRDSKAINLCISMLGSKEYDVRGGAAQFLARFGEAVHGRVLQIAMRGTRGENSLNQRKGALEALGYLKGARSVDVLIEALAIERLNNQAMLSLVKVGKEAAPALIKALDRENIEIQIGALYALGKLKDERAIGPIMKALDHKNLKVRQAAIRALVDQRGEQAIETILSNLDRFKGRDLDTTLFRSGFKEEFEEKLAERLLKIVLGEAGNEKDYKLRIVAFEALQWDFKTDRQVMEKLIDLFRKQLPQDKLNLDRQSDVLWIEIVNFFSYLRDNKSQDKIKNLLLQTLQTHKNQDVRKRVIGALMNWEGVLKEEIQRNKNPEILKEALKRWPDRNWNFNADKEHHNIRSWLMVWDETEPETVMEIAKQYADYPPYGDRERVKIRKALAGVIDREDLSPVQKRSLNEYLKTFDEKVTREQKEEEQRREQWEKIREEEKKKVITTPPIELKKTVPILLEKELEEGKKTTPKKEVVPEEDAKGASLGKEEEYDKIYETLTNLTKPVNVFMSYKDYKALSQDQREELFALATLNPKKLKVVIYGAESYEKRGDNIFITTDEARVSLNLVPKLDNNIQLSKIDEKVMEDLAALKDKTAFFRYQDDSKGLLGVALLLSQAADKKLFAEKYGLEERDGFFIAVSEFLHSLVQEFEAQLVIKIAA